MSDYATIEKRIERSTRPQVHECGVCGTEVRRGKTVCVDCALQFGQAVQIQSGETL